MAVTITTTSNRALTTDLLLSGTINISGALADGSETLNVSLYSSNTGANFTGTPQAYDGVSTVTYNYTNGTTLSVNFTTGNWVYNRLSSETTSLIPINYLFTFDFTDSSGTVSKVENVNTQKNVTITDFSANTLDDLDTQITGTCDVSIVSVAGVNIKVDIIRDSTNLIGTSQSLTSATGVYRWNYVDGSSMIIDLGTKKFTYNRKASDVGDSTVNTYAIELHIGSENLSIYSSSIVGFPPRITTFSGNSIEDTDLKITGDLAISNTATSSISVNLRHDRVSYSGVSQPYVANSSLTWTYADGSSFVYDTFRNTWEYNRVPSDTTNLISDNYIFEVSVTSRYGTDSASSSVSTTVPKATIIGFSADNVMDDSKTITGVLKYNLPSLSTSPSLKIDLTANGASYLVPSVAIGSSAITFNYSNSSKLVVDIAAQTFVYTRASGDITNASPDTYTFECTIMVNGQTTSQTMTVKTLAGVRHYDYEPAYPVLFEPGGTETENTAWPKYIEEIKRFYRLYNENMNYYEAMFQLLNTKLDALEKKVDDNYKELSDRITREIAAIKSLIDSKITELTNTVNDSVQVKAFEYGLRFLGWDNPSPTVPIPPGYTVKQCIFIIMHGGSGSYGVQDLNYSVKMGNNHFRGIQNHKHALVLCNKGWNF